MSEFEAVAEAMTGGLLGRAVEPKAGELPADGHTHEKNCLNCGKSLIGDFCHACGQRAHVHRTLTAFFHDLMHGVLHVEGKIWNTLPLLAWRPGDLTRRYIDGERARFVSPIALFLFSVFLMFAAVSATGGLIGQGGNNIIQIGPNKDIAGGEAALAELRKQREWAIEAGLPTDELDDRISENQQAIAALRRLRGGEIRTGADAEIPDSFPDWFRRLGKNPELTLYKLKTHAYKFSWALIPLSVPFLWLLFPFSRRFRFYDHTVFVTYSLSFMTLLVVAALLLGTAGLTSVAGLLFLVPPFHMYRQLKGAYGRGRWGALWRAALLTMFAMLVIALFSAVLVGIETYG